MWTYNTNILSLSRISHDQFPIIFAMDENGALRHKRSEQLWRKEILLMCVERFRNYIMRKENDLQL